MPESSYQRYRDNWDKAFGTSYPANTPINSSGSGNSQFTEEPDTGPALPLKKPQSDEANEPTGTSRKKCKRPNPWLEFSVQAALCLFTLGAFIAAAVYAGIAYWQRDTMSDQLKVMDRQFDVMTDTFHESQMQSDAAILAASAAENAAETAENALKQSKNAFMIEQRPYLVGELPIWAQEPVTTAKASVNLYLKNIGKTPATKIIKFLKFFRHRGLSKNDPKGADDYVRFIEGAFRALDEKFLELSREKYISLVRTDLAPGDRSFSTAEDEGWNDTYAPLTVTELDDLRNDGKIDLRLVVKAKYSDAFGGAYESEFCWFYFGRNPATWHICDSHNTIK